MNTDKKISRREALKRMGFAVMSGAIASSGLLSLASCETKRCHPGPEKASLPQDLTEWFSIERISSKAF